MKFLLARPFSAILLIVLTVACNQSDGPEVKAGRFGMMSNDTPHYNAIVFFLSVYNEDDLKRATSLTTEQYGRLLNSYKTNKNVQRHVLNFRVENVSVEPMSGSFAVRDEYSNKTAATLEVKLSGPFDGDLIHDLKRVIMVKQKGRWLVSNVQDAM